MGIGEWLGAIWFVLSFPMGVAAGLAAILFAPRLLRFLENRKLIKTNKSKQQALQHYQHIKALRDGSKDKYAYYMLLLGLSVLSAIAASTIIISTFIFAPLYEVLLILLLFAFVVALLSVIFLAAMYETSRRIKQFDRYKAELEGQWGPLD
jgi:membrane protein implicated in regulation of membrane protease activity